MDKISEIWTRMNDSEKFGCQFALFPLWVKDYNLTHEETITLMRRR